MNSIRLKANAKINLTLDVKGKRPDGYHEVEMIMQSVGLADIVTAAVTGGGELRVTCDNPLLPQGEGNLAWRAASAFFERAGCRNPGVLIHIEKKIPSGAGLAGGSADAAATLTGLNRLLEASVSDEALAETALYVGADVPFCLRGGTMLAQGVGERLTALPALGDCPIVIVKPAEAVSTPAAYAAYDRLAEVMRPDTRAVIAALQSGQLSAVARGLCNVLEPAAALPAVARIKTELVAFGALGVCMTGSGSAVYGLFGSQALAAACAERLRGRYQGVFLCRPAAEGCEAAWR